MDSTLDSWKAFVAGGLGNGSPRPVIRESWLRSRCAAVEPAAFACRRVEDADRQRRLAANVDLIDAAGPHLEWVSAALGETPHAVCLTDADGVVLLALGDGSRAPGQDWSERAAGTNGAGLALAAGQAVAVVGAEHFAAPLHDRASAAAPVRCAGRVVGAVDVVTPVADGRAEHVLLAGHLAHAIGRELAAIADRRRAEERLLQEHKDLEQRFGERTAELIEATEFLQALLESIEDGIVACNSVGELTLVNDAGRRLLGLPPEAMPDQRRPLRGLYRADGVTPLAPGEGPLERALCGERVQYAEMMIVPQRGPARTVLASGQAFRGADGHLLGAVVSLHDISARKRAEEALRSAHEGLERRVRERTAELAAANEALRQADRMKDEFLAMLAHELRNPLAPIRNALHIMNQAGADRDMVKRVRVIAERQVAHMTRLLEDLLDMARIRQGRIDLLPEPVDVADLVGRAADAMRSLAQDRRHELTVTPPPRPLRVHGDPTRLEQVLTNLVHNACKYTDPGGHIWLSAEPDDDAGEVVLRVRDDGIGIPPELLGKVFDMFVQVSRRLDRSRGGVGIGLTLVKRLVELHGGTIAARSDGPGRGCEFTVRLPLLNDAAPAAPPRKKAESWHSIGLPDRRVLVVDDNEDAADSLAMLLRVAGQQVRTAYDGPSALAAADEFGPDLAFVDIGMPGMDGHEVARRLREKFGPDRLTLVALTGWGHEEDRRRSREAGFDHHLVKPVEPALLKKLLSGPEE